MNTCPYCSYVNRQGVLVCEACGKILSTLVAEETLPTTEVFILTEELKAPIRVGTARFPTGASVVIHIGNAKQSLVVQPTKRVILGRFNSGSPQSLDIDLSPFQALENGVSRTHAAIELIEDTLFLDDLGSSNGTHVNGRQIVPGQPQILHDGDEIYFGKLAVRIYFM